MYNHHRTALMGFLHVIPGHDHIRRTEKLHKMMPFQFFNRAPLTHSLLFTSHRVVSCLRQPRPDREGCRGRSGRHRPLGYTRDGT